MESARARDALAQPTNDAWKSHKYNTKPPSTSSVLHQSSNPKDKRKDAASTSYAYYHGAQGLSDQLSNEYSDEIANELPSEIDVLKQDDRNRQSEHEPSSRLLSSNPFSTNEGKTGQIEAGASFEDTEFQESNSDTLDIEDALLGLNDSITMQQKLSYDEAKTSLIKAQGPRSNQSQSQKLFCSTDSPDKAAPANNKRDVSKCDFHMPSQTMPPSKRQKAGDSVSKPLLSASNTSDDAGNLSPSVKPGLPAWVYDFDPAFIAEYKDFVEFV